MTLVWWPSWAFKLSFPKGESGPAEQRTHSELLPPFMAEREGTLAVGSVLAVSCTHSRGVPRRCYLMAKPVQPRLLLLSRGKARRGPGKAQEGYSEEAPSRKHKARTWPTLQESGTRQLGKLVPETREVLVSLRAEGTPKYPANPPSRRAP